jgi:integration host factor subunit beta
MAEGKVTKADIIDAIYQKKGISRKDIKTVVDSFLDEIKVSLIANQIIELRGFGTFEIRIRKGRQKARNPKTGESVSVNSHGVALFRSGKELKQDVWNINSSHDTNNNGKES